MTIRDIIINTGEYDGDLNSSSTTTSSVSVSSSVQQVGLGGEFQIPRRKRAHARISARERRSFAREALASRFPDSSD